MDFVTGGCSQKRRRRKSLPPCLPDSVFRSLTDSGPQFISAESEAYLRTNGIEHRKTTPLYPQAKGGVERQIRSLPKCLLIAHLEGKNWRTEWLVWSS